MTTPFPAARAPVAAVLSIAGSDPSGGAGIQADLKTFAAFGVYGAAVVTALTAQTARSVAAIQPVDPAFVSLQLETVLADVDFAAIKIGMLGTNAVARQVASVLRQHGNQNIVIDPVLRASAGAALIDIDGIAALRSTLLPLARVVTPNSLEAGVLLDRAAPQSVEEMGEAARELLELGPEWVLITGGDVETGDHCVDILCGQNGVIHELRVPRVAGPSCHGTGCTLSSAISALLAQGRDVVTACDQAQAYVAAAIGAAHDSTIGPEPGPLIHVLYSPCMTGPSV